jgi:hypothetical protein
VCDRARSGANSGVIRPLSPQFAALLVSAYLGGAARGEEGPPDAGLMGAAPPAGLARWLNPATAPFIPVPEVAVDPVNGTTVGLIPTWITTNADRQVTRIVAPDVLHSEYFGWGMHARVYGYDSADQQWSLVTGIKQRVERELVGTYEVGRDRQSRWSLSATLMYDVDGTPRFYGVGNHTPELNETNYTSQESLGQVQVGFNISHRWQLQYMAKLEVIDVLPGTLEHIDSIEERFPGALGTRKEMLNRFSVVYDSRDDGSIPTRGTQWVLYYGGAGPDGVVTDGYFREAGTDGRVFWPVAPDTVLSSHLALRYLIDPQSVPFWALSSIGGSQSVIGGEQTLRGFGEGRFYDNDYFAASMELRRKVLTVDAVTTALEIEVSPFLDLARVSSHSGADLLDSLHRVVGVGFRGIARPFVVGYVDVGYGSEGAAVFTGLNYPF